MRTIAGLILIVFGIAWLLEALGVADVNVWSHLVKLWPLPVVYFGVAGLRQSLSHPTSPFVRAVNLGVIVVGLLLLAGNYGLIDIGVGDVLSVALAMLLVLVGISIIGSPRGILGGNTQFAVMSGSELKNTEAFELTDQNFVALMGGGDVDLRHAVPAREEVTLTCLAILGGWKIRVPEGMRVEFHGSTLLGGIEAFGEGSGGILAQKSVPATVGDGPLVRIYAQAFMGGIEVKRG